MSPFLSAEAEVDEYDRLFGLFGSLKVNVELEYGSEIVV